MTQTLSIGPLIYEGKAKKLFATGDPQVLWQEFKDDVTAFDGVKKDTIASKGRFNNTIASLLFQYLAQHGVPSHFIAQTGETTMTVHRLQMIPVEVIVRNIAAGSLCRKYGRPEGERFDKPIVEFGLKDDALHDPLMNEDHIRAFGLVSDMKHVEQMRQAALTINELLTEIFAQSGITLVDFKLEFGLDAKGQLRLGDEISPDTCRLWETATGEKLDKDRYRFDLGDLTTGYGRVLELLQAHVR